MSVQPMTTKLRMVCRALKSKLVMTLSLSVKSAIIVGGSCTQALNQHGDWCFRNTVWTGHNRIVATQHCNPALSYPNDSMCYVMDGYSKFLSLIQALWIRRVMPFQRLDPSKCLKHQVDLYSSLVVVYVEYLIIQTDTWTTQTNRTHPVVWSTNMELNGRSL